MPPRHAVHENAQLNLMTLAGYVSRRYLLSPPTSVMVLWKIGTLDGMRGSSFLSQSTIMAEVPETHVLAVASHVRETEGLMATDDD